MRGALESSTGYGESENNPKPRVTRFVRHGLPSKSSPNLYLHKPRLLQNILSAPSNIHSFFPSTILRNQSQPQYLHEAINGGWNWSFPRFRKTLSIRPLQPAWFSPFHMRRLSTGRVSKMTLFTQIFLIYSIHSILTHTYLLRIFAGVLSGA